MTKIEINLTDAGATFRIQGGDVNDHLSLLAETFVTVAETAGIPPTLAVETLFEEELNEDMYATEKSMVREMLKEVTND